MTTDNLIGKAKLTKISKPLYLPRHMAVKRAQELKTQKEKNAYTLLHRFIFNLKRMLQKVGLGSRIASFGVALTLLIREGKFNDESKYLLENELLEYLKKKNLILIHDK